MSELEARARASLERLGAKADTYVAAAKAENTLKAYRSDWREFESWPCAKEATASRKVGIQQSGGLRSALRSGRAG